MCWSATADLAAGSVVTGVGLLSIAMARDRRDVPLAALPIVLGVHQLVEARIWTESAGHGSVVRGPAVLVWTLIAFLVLPVFVPAALLYAERGRRRIHGLAIAAGLVVATVMAFALRDGAHAVDHGHVMTYGVGGGVPLLPLILAGYLFATCAPLLTSPERTLRDLGLALVVAAIAAASVNVLAFVSIWCAFAAVVSLLVVRRTVHAAHRHDPALA